MNSNMNTKQAQIFAANKAGARVIESQGFTLAHVSGRFAVHTYTMINNVCHEFALRGTKLEVYRFDNSGLAQFIGYAGNVKGIQGALEAGKAAGLGMFQPCFTKAAA